MSVICAAISPGGMQLTARQHCTTKSLGSEQQPYRGLEGNCYSNCSTSVSPSSRSIFRNGNLREDGLLGSTHAAPVRSGTRIKTSRSCSKACIENAMENVSMAVIVVTKCCKHTFARRMTLSKPQLWS
jgi:hypothetical protein